MTGLQKQEGCDPTAKQTSHPEQVPTMDDFVVCYKVLSNSDPDAIINDNRDSLKGHPELQRIHVSRTTSALIKHAVSLAALVDERREQIIEEDAESVMRFCNGEINYCPDRAQLMSLINQYGIVLRKCPRSKTWAEKTFGGQDFDEYFDSDELGSRITSYIRRIERDADKMDIVRKVQFVEFAKSALVFLVWTDVNNARYIAYAAKDWSTVQPVEYAA